MFRFLFKAVLVGVLICWITETSPATGQTSEETPQPPRHFVLPYEDWVLLIRPTEDCLLPCWWGVQPSQTPYDQKDAVILTYIEQVTGKHFPAWEGRSLHDFFEPSSRVDFPDWMLSVAVIPTKDNRVVDIVSISFSTSEEISSATEYFSLISILQQYGTPDFIRSDAGYRKDQGLSVRQLAMYWEDIGMAISYERQWHNPPFYEVNPFEPRCFNAGDLGSLYVILQSVDNLRPVDQLLEAGISQELAWLPYLFDISSLNNEELVEILIANDGCLPPDLAVKEIH